MKPLQFGAALLFAAGIAISPSLSTQAVQIRGTTNFVQPPQLLGATATQNAANFPGSTYYFTLTLSEQAGEPLQQIVITQEPSPDQVRFNLKRTEAYEGTYNRVGAKLPIKSVTQDRQTRSITIVLDPPVAPGKTVTIGLNAVQNPSGGVYLYGVTAFPAGEQVKEQFLGYGRINIYNADSSSRLFRR